MARRGLALLKGVAPWAVGFGSVALAALLDVPLCPSASLLGFPCPGCGLTRATLALLRGDLRLALHYHPLVLVVLPFLGLAMAQSLLPALSGVAGTAALRARSERLFLSRATRYGVVLLFVVFVSVWGLRFAGWFGGPVPVETLEQWHSRRAALAALKR